MVKKSQTKKQTVLYWIVGNVTRLYAKLFLRLKIYFGNDAKSFHESIFGSTEGPFIIAPNHASYLDPTLISGSWPAPLHFFAGTHLFEKSKWFSFVLKNLHTHPVNRENGVVALKEAVRFVKNDRQSIVMFPEGTRSMTGQLQALQEGVAFIALKGGAKIVPTCIRGAYEFWPKYSRWPKIFGSVTVHFGDPIDPKDFIGEDGLKNDTKAIIQKITSKIRASIQDLDSRAP